MSTSLDHRTGPLVGDPGDPGLAELRDAFLRARVRDTTVRLSLATFRARGYAQVWGREEEARRWEREAQELSAEVEELRGRLAAGPAGPRDDGPADHPNESARLLV